MPYLFHQNMRVFGPAHAGIPTYPARFDAVRLALLVQGEAVDLAGLTEIRNPGAATVAALNSIVGKLGNGMLVAAIVACGRTAGTPKPEYIAICVPVHRNVQIQAYGRVFLKVTGGVQVIRDEAPAGGQALINWFDDALAAPTADVRGVVYVVVTLSSGANVVAGFVHNVYNFKENRGLFVSRAWDIVDAMRDDSRATALGVTDVYLGGDFNLEPTGRRRGGRNASEAYEYWENVSRNPPAGWGPPIGTTWGHHVYDYWFAGFAGALARPVRAVIADGITMDAGPAHKISDHAASLIST